MSRKKWSVVKNIITAVACVVMLVLMVMMNFSESASRAQYTIPIVVIGVITIAAVVWGEHKFASCPACGRTIGTRRGMLELDSCPNCGEPLDKD